MDHVASASHKAKLAEFQKNQERCKDVAVMFKDSVLMSEKHFARRFKVCHALLTSGVPLASLGIKVNGTEYSSPLRHALEDGNDALMGSAGMGFYVPRVLEFEQKATNDELERARVQSPDGLLRFSIAADGTTHCAEVCRVFCASCVQFFSRSLYVTSVFGGTGL